jgi:tetratricopeptide (TPR) repeat protein
MPKDTRKPRKTPAPGKKLVPQPARPEGNDTITPATQAAVSALLAELQTLSQQLRQSSDRQAARQALASVEGQPEPVVRAFLNGLATTRSPEAADVALALAELAHNRALGKEARRALIRLRSAGITPVFSVPQAAPVMRSNERAFSQGYVTQSRESGEVQLAISWQENQTTGTVRGMVFLLEFWNDGIKEFTLTDVLTPRRFQQHYGVKGTGHEGHAHAHPEVVTCSLAQARALVQEALGINDWRKKPLPDTYKRQHALIRDLLLNAPISEEEAQAVESEGDRPWIGQGMEPEEVVANALGAWAFGDYGLVYDLLADEHNARRTQSRDEYMAQRRQWAEEAKPGGLRLLLIREQSAAAAGASSLWVPTGHRSGGRKELEAFWSLALQDSPLGGQMDELPMGTIINPESQRHWYWTSYTLSQHNSTWRISRQRDEGLAAQGVPIPDLQKHIKDATEEASRIAQSTPQSEQEVEEAYRKLIGTVAASLHYSDALIARLPLDRAPYEQAVLDARSIAQYERAAAYYSKMLDRFADRAQMLTQLGIVQYLAAERDEQERNALGARTWRERATASLEEALALAPNADTYQALGELRARANRMDEAEQLLKSALGFDPTRAEIWSELGTIQLSQNEAQKALESYQQAANRKPDLPGIYFRIGRTYRTLGDTANAQLAYMEAIRHNPNDAESHNNLAGILQEQHPAEAIELLERAVALAPGNALFHANLAAMHFTAGSAKRGRAELEIAEQLDPSNPRVQQVRSLAKSAKK